MDEPLIIGNAQGFWGDDTDAPARLVEQSPQLDYLTLDYLAEVSMSILARQRLQNADVGYPRDFLDVIRSLVPFWKAGRKFRLVTNAGGLNPTACGRAVAAILREAGLGAMSIGIVDGDDVLGELRSALAADPQTQMYCHLETQKKLSEIAATLTTANAYLGAAPVAEALGAGARIVITGRVADPSLTVAPCMNHFNWSATDYDCIAAATVAGHLIECGTQVTGGITTDWLNIQDPTHMGFPLVELSADGSCVVTKPDGSGGRVDLEGVKEQLIYEMGDPGNYLSPDVTASFLDLKLKDVGHDRVRVSGAAGRAPPATYKVSATYHAGYRASAMLTIFGRNAVAKARRCGQMVYERLCDVGCEPFRWDIECLGAGDVVPVPMFQRHADALEVVLRMTITDRRRRVVQRFTKQIAPLVTAGPQGVTGYAEGRPAVRDVYGYWPTLIDTSRVHPTVEVIQP